MAMMTAEEAVEQACVFERDPYGVPIRYLSLPSDAELFLAALRAADWALVPREPIEATESDRDYVLRLVDDHYKSLISRDGRQLSSAHAMLDAERKRVMGWLNRCTVLAASESEGE